MRILVWELKTERATTWRFWRREWWERIKLGSTLAAIAVLGLLVGFSAFLWLLSLVL